MSLYAVQYAYSDDSAARDEHRPAHRAFVAALAQEGVLVASGPLVDDGPAGALLVLRGDSEVQVRDLLREDPFQQQGLVETVTVREWSIVTGAWGQQ